MTDKPKYKCEFCYRPSDEVDMLVVEPMGIVGICDKCVQLCSDIILKRKKGATAPRIETFGENNETTK